MAYSFVGMSALGFDLARLPGGARTGAVLRTALACSGEDLAALAAQHPGAAARAAGRALAPSPAPHPRVAEEVGRAARYVAAPVRRDPEVLRRLEAALLGDGRALERFVRHEALDWTWLRSGGLAVQDPVAADAADVLADAAVAGYHQEELPAEERRALVAPLLRSGLGLRDHTVPVGTGLVDDALAALAGTDGAGRETWRRVVDELRPRTAQWAPAMHRATWVLTVTERLRLAADAQLAAVVAFHQAGLTARDAAYGVWNAVSGTVQALAAIDLLDAADAEVLLRPWQEVGGSVG
ncbi:hypothetical protein [Nocardioides sp. SYSU DS0663]|uniref:hypothetical protein n=1 Tax=Nocardioides sp. SYSU DS0663 TaxID=3416445 RepID=UPI003F4C1074